MTTSVDWGDIDPEDWKPEPPPVKVDDVFIAEACVKVSQRILEDRLANMRRARRAMKNAYDVLMVACELTDQATALVKESLCQWARAKDARGPQ